MTQPRNDYREFLELACIFLGGIPPRGIIFKKPGANHHARWLAKAIHCLKLFMFQDQFFKNAHHCRAVTALRHICIFIVCFYVRIWFMAPRAIKAPQQDLSLLQSLVNFKSINALVAETALKKLKGHLWYLTEELAALALFDSSVPLRVKDKMVEAIREREGTTDNTKRIKLTQQMDQSLPEIDLSHFVSKKSMQLFEITGLPHGFLEESVSTWESNEDFMKCLTVFKDLKVVNDVAERGVALAEEYTGLITKDEDQYQYLLQVVKAHRKQYPNCNKSNFTDAISVGGNPFDQ